jgi:hypothetical protein
MIHLAQARVLIESGQPISIGCWTESGEDIRADNVVCTSSSFHYNTFNLKFLISNQIRKIKAVLIYRVNDEEVVL